MIVDLSFNALTGALRDSFGLFEQLNHFDVSNNMVRVDAVNMRDIYIYIYIQCINSFDSLASFFS